MSSSCDNNYDVAHWLCRSGNVYEGEWHCNERHGRGTMHWYDRGESYTGQWVKGIQQGQGEHVWIIQGSDNAQVSYIPNSVIISIMIIMAIKNNTQTLGHVFIVIAMILLCLRSEYYKY